MTILILSDNPAGYQQILKKHCEQIKAISPEIEVLISASPSKEEREKVDILIPAVNASRLILSDYPSLKWIHTTSAGVNGLPEDVFISDITLTNSSGVHPNPISEHIFTYLLMFARDITATYANQKAKKWDKQHLSTFELHGKTIGIIGLGRIGNEVAHIAKAFSMKVLAVKTKQEKIDTVDEMFGPEDLHSVLSQSDFIINCLPSTSETHNLFTFETFKSMKQTSYFINIGRGTTVVEADLIKALRENVIAGAGLDVFETEPLSETSELWDMENVIITPHSAGMTPEYANRMIDIFCQNLQAYINKKPLPNLVNKTKGY